MASLTIRNLDERTKKRLRLRAAERGHSMEEEARTILANALTEETPPDEGGLGSRLRARFAKFGGVDLKIPPRRSFRPPPSFDE